MEPHAELTETEVQEMESYTHDSDLCGAVEGIMNYFENMNNVFLNVAVAGESRVGKSTFVTAFLELRDEEAATKRVTVTKMEKKAYSHPKYKNVKYSELPRIKTHKCKSQDYLTKMNFDDYDFFIIIVSKRIRECNLQLARAIQARGKKFYFVRSKIGQDITKKKRKKKSFNTKKKLEKIKGDCLKRCRKGDIDNPEVFLLDCLGKEKYDYDFLLETIEEELPADKRHVFLMSLPNISQSVLEKKRGVLRQQIWKKATLVSAATIVPIRGLGRACEVPVLMMTMREYQATFGLDEDSLNKLSNLSGKSLSELKSVIRSPHVIGELNTETVMEMTPKTTMEKIVEMSKIFLSRIALFGWLAAGGLSFWKTYEMLNNFLSECAEDAKRVLDKANED